ncbi:hypothetical protein DEO72_LG7g3283 [Vigna unguiculata]|uniref:SAM domain-containing protein n=1 Tax=Vigna unguiculata TaxID=3917 RepID=A0A4D6MMW3_VIGUN|nr:hypothetical protein DEO72_LG7g3283 [Vigna unguiculata]
MNKGQSPEPLDFFIWTVEDVGLWLETINLGSYRQIFKENGVNGEYLEGMSMFTTEQILRFIRRCHMNGLSERGAEGAAAVVGTGMPIHSVLKGCKIQQTIKSCFPEAGTMIQKISPTVPVGLSERGAEGAAAVVGTGMPIHSVLKGCKIQQTIKSCFPEAGTMIQKISPTVPVYV